jgi:Flp pilus assembly protein TadG
MRADERAAPADRGMITLQAGLVLAFVIGLSAFVVDQGLLLVARAQAQNAADAAAITGALSRALVNETPATVAAQAVSMAEANTVWFEPPSISAGDVTVRTCQNPQSWWPAGDECVTATVYRTSSRGNPLPTIFANFIGVGGQDVVATGVARVASAGITDCLRPFAIPDKWTENTDCMNNPTGVWTPDSTFDTTWCQGPLKGQPLPNPDKYVAPSPSSPGTGFTTADYGMRLKLKSGSSIAGSWFGALALARNGQVSNGTPAYVTNIESCTGTFTSYGAQIKLLPGNRIGPTAKGIDTLIGSDPDASWDASSRRIRGGCMAAGTCAKSPRLIAVGVLDVSLFANGSNPGTVTIRNIMGFFIDGFDGNNLMGYLTYYPGIVSRQAPAIDGQASFLKAAVLAR